MSAALLLLHGRLPGATPIRAEAFRARCPVHAGQSQSLSVRQGDERVLIHCFAGCDSTAVLAAVGLTWRDLHEADDRCRVLPRQVVDACPPGPVTGQPARSHRRRLAREIWQSSSDLRGSLGERYLQARGVPRPPPGADLRFHLDAHVFGLHGPALVARISAAAEAARGIGVHITYLHEGDGRPARLERRYVGHKRGGVVRLFTDDEVMAARALGIGEGIETTLALHALARVPVWACLDAGNLSAFQVLPGIEVLHVAVDRDESKAGQRAALAVAERWQAADREVVAWAADETGGDLADVLQEAVA